MKTPTLARLAVFTALLLHSVPQAFGFGAGSNTFATATSANDGTQTSTGTNLIAYTAEAGEPGHRLNGSNGALKSAWWTYTPAESGYLTVDTRQNLTLVNPNSGVLDTVLAVYTGATVNNLVRVASGDDYGSEAIEGQRLLTKVSFYAVKNTQYYIAVDGFDGNFINANQFNVVLSIRLLPLRTLTRTGIVSASSSADKVGSLTYTTTTTGGFSGSFKLGGKVTALKGAFSHDGFATIIIPRTAAKGSPPVLPYTLVIDGAIGGAAYLYSSDVNGFTVGMYEAIPYTTLNPNPLAAYYAGVADFSSNNAHGSITATVKPTGNVTGTFTAIDGTVVTYSSPVYNDPSNINFKFLQIYKSLFANQGYLYGTPTITEDGLYDRYDGNLFYRRPAAKPGVLFYPAGIFDSVTIQANTYNKPAANARALGFLNAFNGIGNLFLFDEGGELGGDITENLTFTTANKFIFGNATRKPVLTLNTATGLVTGSITTPPLKKRTIKGVLYRYGGGVYLRGHVTGTAKNLEIEVGL